MHVIHTSTWSQSFLGVLGCWWKRTATFFFSGNEIAKCDLKTCLASWLKSLAFLPPNGSLGLKLLQISPTAWGYQTYYICCVCISPEVSDNPSCWISWPRIFSTKKNNFPSNKKLKRSMVQLWRFFLRTQTSWVWEFSRWVSRTPSRTTSHHRGDLARSPQKWPYYILLSG